jgi:hypothetical protein
LNALLDGFDPLADESVLTSQGNEVKNSFNALFNRNIQADRWIGSFFFCFGQMRLLLVLLQLYLGCLLAFKKQPMVSCTRSSAYKSNQQTGP